MALSEDKIKQYVRRLLLSRMRILCNHAFYGLLLMHIRFSVDENLETACTDGERIVFGTHFLDDLNDKELDFVLMHEILHVALQHWSRLGQLEHEEFNTACDIVVNSIILQENHMQLDSITLKKYGVSQHLAPNGMEGYKYSAEEVYQMLLGVQGKSGDKKKKGRLVVSAGEGSPQEDTFWDNHSLWGKDAGSEILKDTWQKRLEMACEAVSMREGNKNCGSIPLFAKRMLQDLRKAQTDWRTILNDFVQEEIVDYSFLPPDHRFADSPFFLPDFNEMDDRVEDILFMIDTSGSMSDAMITAAYSEIKGAIDQFDGKLKGWLGFFDAEVVEPRPFASEEEFRKIAPSGGGGTRFDIIFKYVKNHMQENQPASIIILTDGFAKFPEEEERMGIPVLWLLNNEDIVPPWGKVARIRIGK